MHIMYKIEHSAKGTTWKDHKYIRKVGNRYVYSEEDVARLLNRNRRGTFQSESKEKTNASFGTAKARQNVEATSTSTSQSLNRALNRVKDVRINLGGGRSAYIFREDRGGERNRKRYSEETGVSPMTIADKAMDKLKDIIIGKPGKVRSSNK